MENKEEVLTWRSDSKWTKMDVKQNQTNVKPGIVYMEASSLGYYMMNLRVSNLPWR